MSLGSRTASPSFQHSRSRSDQRFDRTRLCLQRLEDLDSVELEKESSHDREDDRYAPNMDLKPLLGPILRASEPTLKSIVGLSSRALHGRAKVCERIDDRLFCLVARETVS